MDISLNYKYKNAEIVIIVEDDCITTAKTYIDGKMVDSFDVETEDHKDVPFKKDNLISVQKMCKEGVDKIWAEEMATALATA